MTQERSRLMGRAIIAWSGIQFVLFALGMRRKSALVTLPLGLCVAALSAFCFWVGYTLTTIDWDSPADYPPAEDIDSK